MTCEAELARLVHELGSPAWLLREGAVPMQAPAALPKSATGKPIVAVGRSYALPGASPTRALFPPESEVRPWELRGPFVPGSLVSLYVEDALALFADPKKTLEEALSSATLEGSLRAFLHPAFDVELDPRLRVLEVTTTLHRGGAERIVLDLHRELPKLGATSFLATTSRAVRSTFGSPEGTQHLHETGETLPELVVRLAVDVTHTHLLDGPRLEALVSTRVPTLLHLHNARTGWPEGTSEGAAPALVVACAHGVAKDAEAHFPKAVRTIWNGITPKAPSAGARERLRAARGVAEGERVLLALANVRPQKNLPELVSVLEALVSQGISASLWLVGEPVARNEASLAEETRLTRAIAESPVSHRVRRLGPSETPEDELDAADVLVSASHHEGLSLVHLEALAAGLPIVAREVSGLEEIASRHVGRVMRVPAEATVRSFAEAVRDAPSREPLGTLVEDFSSRTMARTTLAMLERAASSASHAASATNTSKSTSLLLVTNNLVVGGAQSSARRLLVALHGRGFRVACATIEEQPEHPTSGSLDLESRGVPVFRAPSVRLHDPLASALEVARFCSFEGVTHVVFWNVIAEAKAWLAELLVEPRIFDVSPGEMYFASLERYFRSPRCGLALDTTRRYGARLDGAIVKYEDEVARARDVLDVPVSVVRNGVPLPSLASRRDHPTKLVIGTAARLSPDKKLEELLDAFRECHVHLERRGHVQLRIAGGPDRGCEGYRDALIERARDLPVTFVGELSEVSSFLDELDVFAAVSEPSGCPNASLEAMAKGLPLVATDVGGTREQVIHGESGLVTPRGDVRALAAAMRRLVGDSALRGRLGDAARIRIEREFTVDRMADDYARILGLTRGA